MICSPMRFSWFRLNSSEADSPSAGRRTGAGGSPWAWDVTGELLASLAWQAALYGSAVLLLEAGVLPRLWRHARAAWAARWGGLSSGAAGRAGYAPLPGQGEEDMAGTAAAGSAVEAAAAAAAEQGEVAPEDGDGAAERRMLQAGTGAGAGAESTGRARGTPCLAETHPSGVRWRPERRGVHCQAHVALLQLLCGTHALWPGPWDWQRELQPTLSLFHPVPSQAGPPPLPVLLLGVSKTYLQQPGSSAGGGGEAQGQAGGSALHAHPAASSSSPPVLVRAVQNLWLGIGRPQQQQQDEALATGGQHGGQDGSSGGSATALAGECFGLLGVNGAGKTTTFKMVTGKQTRQQRWPALLLFFPL